MPKGVGIPAVSPGLIEKYVAADTRMLCSFAQDRPNDQTGPSRWRRRQGSSSLFLFTDALGRGCWSAPLCSTVRPFNASE
jgi:hypothetical protein